MGKEGIKFSCCNASGRLDLTRQTTGVIFASPAAYKSNEQTDLVLSSKLTG